VLLDFGCGLVPLYDAYRGFVSSIVCLDWENSPHSNPYLDATQDLSGVINLESESFDTILVSDVFEHLPDPALTWTELNRLLRPGGKIILNVPFFYGLHESPHDYYRFTEYALRLLAERAGFAVVELESIGGLRKSLRTL
jgi:SAM-dependent methyltransferase